MPFPDSNLVGSDITASWESIWRLPSLISGDSDVAKYGFRDFKLDDEFSVFRFLMTDYEYKWDGFAEWALSLRHTFWVAVVVSLLYIVAISVGQRMMENRKAFDLKYILFLWNLGLAVFSIIGVIRILPTFLFGLARNGPMYYVCRNGYVTYGRGSVGLWSLAFVLSKYVELVDTLFLVLRKKPVPFLHWFHHATVLLISIGTIMLHGPSGIVMLVVNYLVHSIMYTYYAIAAIGKPPRWGKIVTKLQIAQMVNGLLLASAMVYGSNYVVNCEVNQTNLYGILFVYASYLVLFVQFYINRYIKRNDVKKSE